MSEHYPSAPKVAKGTVRWKPTEESKRRREWFAERNERIQKIGVRPADGVTFGKGKKEKG